MTIGWSSAPPHGFQSVQYRSARRHGDTVTGYGDRHTRHRARVRTAAHVDPADHSGPRVLHSENAQSTVGVVETAGCPANPRIEASGRQECHLGIVKRAYSLPVAIAMERDRRGDISEDGRQAATVLLGQHGYVVSSLCDVAKHPGQSEPRA